MMAKNPKHRYQTPAEVAIALEPFALATAIAPKREPRRYSTKESYSRTLVLEKLPACHRSGRRIVALAAALLFVVAGLFGVAVYHIATDKGELVITTESDDVKVVISKGGELVDVIDTKTDKQIRLAFHSGEYELELKGAPEGLKLNIDKATLTRGKETLAKIERVETTPPEKVGQVHCFEGAAGLCGIAISPNGRYLLSTGTSIQLWDLHDRKYVHSFPGHSRVHAVAFLPDSREFLSCSKDGIMQHWDVETGKELHRADLGAADLDLYDVVVSPNGSLALAGGSVDKTVHLWDVKNWKEIRRFEGHTSNVQRVVFSADGRRALSGSWDKTARLRDVETGKELKCFVHQAGVMGVALSPDGRLALSGGGDKPLRLWDVETGKELRHFEGHTGVVGVAFSPDGRFALSGSEDHSVRLWEVATGKELHRFDGHQAMVWSVVFSRDGRYALSGGQDNTVRLWRLPDPPPSKEKKESP
jgi:WD40 repeat protein